MRVSPVPPMPANPVQYSVMRRSAVQCNAFTSDSKPAGARPLGKRQVRHRQRLLPHRCAAAEKASSCNSLRTHCANHTAHNFAKAKGKRGANKCQHSLLALCSYFCLAAAAKPNAGVSASLAEGLANSFGVRALQLAASSHGDQFESRPTSVCDSASQPTLAQDAIH